MGIIVHVPHASTRIPEGVRRGITLDDATLARELLASTDHHTDAFVAGLEEEHGGGRLGPGDSGGRVRVHVNGLSRLVVDPERFLDPEREVTEAVGRGAVYTRCVDGTLLRDDAAPHWEEVRADLIARHFIPYHAQVDRLVAQMVADHGHCTLIDVHSYPREAQPYELASGLDPAAPRPELCIGTDATHTPVWLLAGVEEVAHLLGIQTARDTPFAGTFVPGSWLGDGRVRSVMLEVRRDSYLDEVTGVLDAAGVARVRELVRQVVLRVLEEGQRPS
jgi:N-formylglutamate deformylase